MKRTKKRRCLRSVAARNRLVEKNLPFVYWYVNRIRAKNKDIERLEYDDAIQAGMLGLIRAAELYDPAKGSLRTLAGWWILTSVQASLIHREVVKVPRHIIEQRPGVTEKPPSVYHADVYNDEGPLTDWLPRTDDTVDKDIQAEQVMAWVERLPDRLKQMVHLVYFDGFTVTDAATIMRVSRHVGIGLLKFALRELRRMADREEQQLERTCVA